MTDTTPEMNQKMWELMLAKSGEERLMMGCSMHEMSKSLVVSGILSLYPDVPPNVLRQEIFLRFYGNDFSAPEKDSILSWLMLDRRA